MDSIFITALNIKHVRHLKNISIELSPTERKALILTGKNGSGKTSVLEALNDYLSQKAYSNNALTATFSSDTHNLTDNFYNGEYIIAYYADNREIKVETPKNIEHVILNDKYYSEEHPSHLLVKYLVDMKSTAAFARQDGDLKQASEIDAWFDRFEQILQNIYDDKTLELKFYSRTYSFSILKEGREPFDFNTMSMGYAAVFDIIADIVMRMEAKHRYDLEGIVLIDEIETHLHVDLQKKIMPILMKLFPNIQFIITTHSPFILNSTPNAVIYDLEKQIRVADGLTNLPYEGIVEGYFGVDTMSQKLRDKFSKYKELVQKDSLTDVEFAEIAELGMYLDEVPKYLALEFSAEYSRLKLEFSQREWN